MTRSPCSPTPSSEESSHAAEGTDENTAMRRYSVETSHSSGSAGESADYSGSPAAAARRRNPIAAQACETCRTRKTRCDEQRPRCGLCERLDLTCVYREPRPTKRDKTAETILATMKRIDKKLDDLMEQRSQVFEQQPLPPMMPWRESGEVLDPMHVDATASVAAPEALRQQRLPHVLDDADLRGALSVFPWPSVQVLLAGADRATAKDLEEILAEGSSWLMRHEILSTHNSLPCDVFLRGTNLHVIRADKEQARVAYFDLTAEVMDKYAHAYFGSYNLVYPVLDRQDFMDSVLPTVKRHGFADGCLHSLLALLVLALGALSCDGVNGNPLKQGSGIRGGTAERPPALDIFNEARRRVGFVMGSCTVEDAQALVLMAIFYETCSKHLEHWRMTITATEVMKAVLRIERSWDSHGVDMIRRVYWTCNVIESWYYLDLNLPRSDASGFQEFIALPDFDNRRDFAGEPSVESKYQYNFLSMVSLRRLIHRAFEELYDPESGHSTDDKADRTIVIAELARQLDVWRTLLPHELRWDDAARTTYDIDERTVARGISAVPAPLHIDILLAQLRCRYYYARFMIFRPYAWKALHAPPGSLAQAPVVVDGFVNAVDSMLNWPVAYPPVCDKKRLIPNIFAWTQSFVMFLLVLRAIKENELLWRMCAERLGQARIEESVAVMLEWIRDLKMVDSVAEWAWRTLTPLYGLGD